MSDAYPWYVLANGAQLEQGDLLSDRSIFREADDGSFRRDTAAVVVLSHSCDLANDKLELVQVCPYWPLEMLSIRVEHLRSRRGREDLRRGNLPGYHLLNRCSLPGFERDYLVVDFRSLFGTRLATVKALAAVQSPRLRLLPPYREHLAQSFARFFMRVGLPVDIPPF